MNKPLQTSPLLCLLSFLLLVACASISNPDGGPYDETPPLMLSSSPKLGATNISQKKISLYFNEYIKLENANEKVVFSPTQIDMPEIKVNGKRIDILLVDTLQADATYTIDFSDAIVDNNEGNPMGSFTYSFATGDVLDTLEVSGVVLEAENNEPVKGILVGLLKNLADSAFTASPLERISRTNGSGRFTIKGVKAGEYRIYALNDVNGNIFFDQKSEKIAFTSDLIIPSYTESLRSDTLWADSTRIDTVIQKPYTQFLPNNIVLRAFTEVQTHQYLVKAERELPTTFSIYFGAKSDTLPTLRGLNFNEKNAFVLEASQTNDTLKYWITDSVVYNLDTLRIAINYLETDSLKQLVSRTDTLELTAKMNRTQLEREQKKRIEEWEKEQRKQLKEKNLEDENSSLPPYPLPSLTLTLKGIGSIAPNQNITFEFAEPIAHFDSLGVRLQVKVDTLWHPVPHYIENINGNPRLFQLYGEWKPEQKYQLEIDSAAFISIFGKAVEEKKNEISVKKLDEFSTLYLTVVAPDSNLIIQLLDTSDKVAYTEAASPQGLAQFFFVRPGKYYVRAYVDTNQDGIWTTGEYETQQQPEQVYYYPKSLELKAAWEVRQSWTVDSTPLEKQKPLDITKQKPDTEKKVKNRNEEREKEKNKR